MNNSPCLLHVVRQYGPVGGMERYVWELTHALANSGAHIEVLCEHIHQAPGDGIVAHELGQVQRKPRWLSSLLFSRRASTWLKNHPDNNWLIHSHDTTGFHHITTFHGPPFANVRQRPIWRNLSLRVQANLWIEQRQVCGPQVSAVIPNSALISEQLNHFYPCIDKHMQSSILPGVAEMDERPAREINRDGGIVGFVGREWKRKGLELAVDIVRRMREFRPEFELHVIGPEADRIRHLFNDWNGGYKLLGPCDAKPRYPGFDLLLHPANMEPFGMVITEALAARVPVVVSQQCGARSEVEPERVLPVDAPLHMWVECCIAALGRPQACYSRSWRDVADEHMTLYQSRLFNG